MDAGCELSPLCRRSALWAQVHSTVLVGIIGDNSTTGVVYHNQCIESWASQSPIQTTVTDLVLVLKFKFVHRPLTVLTSYPGLPNTQEVLKLLEPQTRSKTLRQNQTGTNRLSLLKLTKNEEVGF